MHWKVGARTGSRLLWLGACAGAAHHLLLLWFFPHAFEGALDRLLFLTGWTATTALVIGGAGLVWGAAASRLRLPEGSWRILPPASLLLTGFALLWVMALTTPTHAGAWLTVSIASAGLGAAGAVLYGRLRLPGEPAAPRAVAFSLLALGGVGLASFGLTGVGAPVPPPGSDEAPGRTAPARWLPAGTNVLLILVDTLRADHLSYAGYPRETSPRIDRLAASGVVFREAVAQATRTSPNMASLLTSLTPFRHSIIGARSVLDEGLVTWGEILQAQGFHTKALLANPNMSHRFQFTQGIAEADELFHSEESSRAEILTTKAVGWLRKDLREPFFLWMHYVDPHIPYAPPPPYDQWFVGDPLYQQQAGRLLPFTDASRHGGISRRAVLGELRSLADYVARYDGEIRYTDHWIGELLDVLAGLELLDRTLVVFTSDHGESLGEHDYFFSHGTYAYDATARVPLILRHPRLPAGRQLGAVVRTIDILPTVLDLLGVSAPGAFEGRSLVPELRQEEAAAPVVSISAGEPGSVTLAARTERWKLILTPRIWPGVDRLVQWQLQMWPNRHRRVALRHRSYRAALYDLRNDPGETRDRRREERAVASELLTRILAWVDRAEMSSKPAQVEVEEIDPATAERLRELGYVE